MSLTKNPHPQVKKFFRVQTKKLAASFDASTRSGDIPAQSHVRFGVFFRKSPKARRQSVNNYTN